jgi:hypothetical protein
MSFDFNTPVSSSSEPPQRHRFAIYGFIDIAASTSSGEVEINIQEFLATLGVHQPVITLQPARRDAQTASSARSRRDSQRRFHNTSYQPSPAESSEPTATRESYTTRSKGKGPAVSISKPPKPDKATDSSKDTSNLAQATEALHNKSKSLKAEHPWRMYHYIRAETLTFSFQRDTP